MDNVKDRIVQYANRYKLTNADTGEVLGTFDFDEVTGTVTEAGTEINKALFDSIAEDFTAIINGTQPVGAVGATQITTQDLNTFYGADWWGKMLYMAGGNSVLNKPAGIDTGNVNILRGAFNSTIQIAIGTNDSTGNSPAPNIYIRRLIDSTSSWDDWEQIVTADGNYPTLGVGESETLTEPFTVGKDTTAATTGYVKFASVRLPAAYRSASARFEVLDKNPVNAQTQMCGVEVVVKNISTTNVDVVPRLLYGSSAYLSKIYACVKKGSYPVLVDLYFDISSTNPQETISCIKPLFTFTRVTRSTTFTFISDNEPVSALPTDTTNTQLSTVRVLVTEAADSAKLNGKAASDIFESDGVTAKEATNAQKLGNKAAEEYALADNIPDVSNFAEKDGTYSDMTVGNAEKLNGKNVTQLYKSIKSVQPVIEPFWEPKTWNINVDGNDTWTDGVHIYNSYSFSHYVLNDSGEWEQKNWSGLSSVNNFYARNVWTDGVNIYYSRDNQHFMYNSEIDDWEPVEWNIWLIGQSVWTDGINIYYSNGSVHYYLDKKTNTWLSKTWNGLTNFFGGGIWTDGVNIYHSNIGFTHMLIGSMWVEINTQNSSRLDGAKIWRYKGKIYHLNNMYNISQVFNSFTNSWEDKPWNVSSIADANRIWSDTKNVYYSFGEAQYVLRCPQIENVFLK